MRVLRCAAGSWDTSCERRGIACSLGISVNACDQVNLHILTMATHSAYIAFGISGSGSFFK